VEYCKPSFGNFLATARTAWWFGIPRSVSFPGLMMDIQRYAVMNVAKDYNSAIDISYNRQSGMRASAYEHLIPEKLFTDQTQPNAPQAISAVKALAIAASQGQKIYTITQANQDIILPQINVDPDVMTEMQNALSAGKEVTVHQSPITQSGWTGTGYIITDPATGAGAYKISGGANGAELANAYWASYFTWTSEHLIAIDPGYVLATLLPFMPAMKYWFGLQPLMGSKNAYTTIIRGLSVVFAQNFGFSIPLAKPLGRTLWPLVFFIGIYDFTILFEGLFYAGNYRESYVLVNAARNRGYCVAGSV
jgi:hypothetical protein